MASCKRQTRTVPTRGTLLSLLAWALLALAPTWGAAEEYLEGAHYKLIEPPAPTSAPAGKVEVVELFWYGCPHCYAFEPYLDSWLKAMPAQAAFSRVPAVLNRGWGVHAQAYYAAQILGIAGKLHRPLFDALHKDHQRLYDKDSIVAFVARQGLDAATFREAFDSFEVNLRLRQADRLGTAYQATGVPAMIVNGKYLVSASTAGGYDEMLKVVDYLVVQEGRLAAARP